VGASGAAMMCMGGLSAGWLQDLLIGLSFSLGAVVFPLGSALIGEITPPAQRGAMLGITNSIHTLAGLLAPMMMGRIIDACASPAIGFRMGFMMNGAMVVVLGSAAAALIDPRADLARFGRETPRFIPNRSAMSDDA
jgi:MFS family permease